MLLVEIEDYEQLIEGLDTESVSRVLGQLERTCRLLGGQEATAIRQSAARWALLLPDCDRRDAVQLASEVIARLEGRGPARATFELPCRITMNVGVATVAVPPKSFRAEKLWESARRCLDAARASSGHAVKSIEVC